MKLELKHIAPYLPYGLRTVNFNTNRLIDGPLFSEVIPANILGFIDGSTESKIILRPLSYLNSDNADFLSSDGYMSVCEECVYIDEMRYSDVEKLIKRHYDVFNLIDNGLAIDINTLES
jgi:hypothetical protein